MAFFNNKKIHELAFYFLPVYHQLAFFSLFGEIPFRFSHAETPRGGGAEGGERGRNSTRMVRMPLRGFGWLGGGWESTGTGRETLRGQKREGYGAVAPSGRAGEEWEG